MTGSILALLLLAAPQHAIAFDFSYVYANPYDAHAQTYIQSTSNIHLYSEGSVRMWIPIAGGATQATTTPGVIT